MNLLLITADDMNGDTPGCCGGPPSVTPAIDRLASDGVLFRRAHVPVAICQPSRSALMTGRFPHRNGAEGFEPIDPGIPVLTDVLKAAGMRVGILGKVDHLAPVERFGWDTIVTFPQLGLGRDPGRYAAATRSFLQAAATEGRDWFLMANAHDPHRPFHGSPDEASFPPAALAEVPAPSYVFSPGEWPVPGFLPDLPDARRELAEYLSSCRRCDDVVAAVLAEVDAAGRRDDTLVVFLSDNGMAFPFAKANCYLHGTRTPLVVRWPGVTGHGTVDVTHFVSTLDLFATFCDAVGAAVPDDLDGASLLDVLQGRLDPRRDHVATVFHENWGKQRFEMRCLQTGEFGYLWNAWADGNARYFAEHMQTATWRAIEAAAETDRVVAARRDYYLIRQPEELYAVYDSDSLRDLTGEPWAGDVLREFRERMHRWMVDVGDPLELRYRELVNA
jgi:N-sulfoglucosamine sulfohydrolase